MGGESGEDCLVCDRPALDHSDFSLLLCFSSFWVEPQSLSLLGFVLFVLQNTF